MLISSAFAQSGGLAEGGFGLLPIIFVMVIFYFLLIRPQQKRAKQHKEMLGAMRRGDKIVTSRWSCRNRRQGNRRKRHR